MVINDIEKRAKKAAEMRQFRANHPGYSWSAQKRYRFNHRHPCPDCGKLIDPRSKRCISCWNKIKAWNKKHPGDKSPRWGGGRIKRGHGYMAIYAPNHPRAIDRYVYEHIIVWEQAHGTSLPPNWCIHHINGIKNDNRPENLAALPDRKHKHILAIKAKRIQELEGLLRRQQQLI